MHHLKVIQKLTFNSFKLFVVTFLKFSFFKKPKALIQLPF